MALVTHEAEVAAFARRIVVVRDGRIVKDQVHVPVSAAEQLQQGVP